MSFLERHLFGANFGEWLRFFSSNGPWHVQGTGISYAKAMKGEEYAFTKAGVPGAEKRH